MLYVATFMSTILNFVASKVNTDYLSPADYGNVRYVFNIIQLFSWVVLFGWFMSGSRLLALSDNRKYSARIRGALIILLIAASVMLMIITSVSGLIHTGNNTIRTLFYCAIPVCMYPLLTNYINTTAQGDNHIGRLALARLLPVLCYIPLALLVYGRYGADSRTVIWMHWGVCAAVIIIIIISTRPSFHDLKPVFRSLGEENRSYGIQLYWGSLAMVATNYLAGVVLGFMDLDKSNVGFYTLALSFAQPLSYLPAIVGTTFFKRFAQEERISNKVFAVTIAITVVTCIGFIVLVHPVMSLYNKSYGVVARYASFLAIGFSMHGVGDMINRYLGSHGQGRSIRNSSFLCGAVKITGSFVLVWLWSVNGAILTMILSSAVYALSLYIEYRIYVKVK